MKKIVKIALTLDAFLIAIILLTLFVGCHLRREDRAQQRIIDKHKIIFKIHDTSSMIFIPDASTNLYATKSALATLPHMNIVVTDIPANAADIAEILKMHYTVSLGFLPGVDNMIINKASYDGHNIFIRITVGNDDSYTINLNLTDDENIVSIHKLLASGDYDGTYIAIEDRENLLQYPDLFNAVTNAIAFLTINKNICYKENVCYITSSADLAHVKTAFKRAKKFSETAGEWTIILQYRANIAQVVTDMITDID